MREILKRLALGTAVAGILVAVMAPAFPKQR